jgi:hypothetical protein
VAGDARDLSLPSLQQQTALQAQGSRNKQGQRLAYCSLSWIYLAVMSALPRSNDPISNPFRTFAEWLELNG